MVVVDMVTSVVVRVMDMVVDMVGVLDRDMVLDRSVDIVMDNAMIMGWSWRWRW